MKMQKKIKQLVIVNMMMKIVFLVLMIEVSVIRIIMKLEMIMIHMDIRNVIKIQSDII